MKSKFLLSVFLSFGMAAANLAADPKEGGTVFKEGALVQGTGAVFLIRDGLRCGFSSMEVFLANGYEGKNVIRVSDEELARIPEGPALTAPIKPRPYKTAKDGDLIQALVEEDGRFKPVGPVFLIRGDVRCGIPTMAMFDAKGFKAGDVILISEEDMGNIPTGRNLE